MSPGTRERRRFWGQWLIVLGLMGSAVGPASGQDLTDFQDRVSRKIKSYSETQSWKASAVTTITKMNKDGVPEDVTVITKTLTVASGERSERILKAVETKEGKIRDVTAKYAEEAGKRVARERRRRTERTAKEGENEDGRSRAIDEFLPFAEARRNQFTFVLHPHAELEGSPAVLVEVTAKVRNERNWEGRFYFDPKTDDLLRIEVRPSENPSLVKELEVRMSFELLAGSTLAIRKSWIKINAGNFLKHVRQVIEEEYSDFEIL